METNHHESADSIEIESIPEAYRVDFLRLINVPIRQGRNPPGLRFTTEDGYPIAFVVVSKSRRSVEYRVFSDPETTDGLFKLIKHHKWNKVETRVVDSKTEETIGSIDSATARSLRLDRTRWILRDEAGDVRGRVYRSSKLRNMKSIVSTLLSIAMILFGVHIFIHDEREIQFEIEDRIAARGEKHRNIIKARFDLDLCEDLYRLLPRPIALSVAILEFLRKD